MKTQIHHSPNLIKEYSVLFKVRLSLMVLISAVLGYMISIVGNGEFKLDTFIKLSTGGFLLTVASSAINQILEKNSDALMSRTKNRPVVKGSLHPIYNFILSFCLAAVGIYMLYLININCFILGLSAFISYCFVYTPLKKVTTFSVLIGAFPGAIPPMLGWLAGGNPFSFGAGTLFAIQFIWQFPHFWSIAWKLNEDYKKANLKMLPFGKKDKRTALFILLTAVCLLLLTILLAITGFCSILGSILIGLLSLPIVYYCYKLLCSLDDKYALKIMFASYLYLLGSLGTIFMDKVINFNY